MLALSETCKITSMEEKIAVKPDQSQEEAIDSSTHLPSEASSLRDAEPWDLKPHQAQRGSDSQFQMKYEPAKKDRKLSNVMSPLHYHQ